MPFNLPIFLTWCRILAIPLLLGCYYLPLNGMDIPSRDLMALLIFVLAALTDWADGFLARRLNQTSAFGEFLDPVADKLMVATSLIILVQLGRSDAALAVIIIGREITISALREWMAKIGASKNVAVSLLGKIKTTAQMLSIPFLLYHRPLDTPMGSIDCAAYGTAFLWVAALLTLWSMGYYLAIAWPEIAKQTEPPA